MKIFVTVGTTSFDDLIMYLDNLDTENEIIFQISDDHKYIPVNHKYFTFTDDIEEYYNMSDVVITHSGAGSVYRLLELKKKIIIVPNMTRVDGHQMDLANFMKDNKFALVCTDIKELDQMIKNFHSSEIEKYKFDPFFKQDEIIDIIKKAYRI